MRWNSSDNVFARGGGTGRQSFSNSYRTSFDVGVVFGGCGVRLETRRLTVVPELRYTRWSPSNFGEGRNHNRAEALFTIRFWQTPALS